MHYRKSRGGGEEKKDSTAKQAVEMGLEILTEGALLFDISVGKYVPT